MGVASSTLVRDTKVLSVIGAGHMMSHLFHYTLPPLFPFIRDDYGLSFTQLGLLMSLFAGAAAVAQMPVGMLVDRIGARAILIGGLALEAASIGGMAFSPSYPVLLVLATLGGLGHSVFHPADYALILSSVDESRMGRAFSIHGVTGRIGSALAFPVLAFLAGVWNWKVGIVVVAIFGLTVALALTSQIHILHDLNDESMGRKSPKSEGSRTSTEGAGSHVRNLRLLYSTPVVLLFSFFLVTTMATNGIQTFSIVALKEIHGTPVEISAAAVTGFLVAAAVGGLIGGWVADHTTRHNMIASAAFVAVAAALVIIGEVNLPGVLLFGVLGAIGLLQGLVGPARDMMVKAIMPPGSAGTLFAFMSMGRLLGATAAPAVIGVIMDAGGKAYLFWVLAGFAILGLLTLNAPRRRAV